MAERERISMSPEEVAAFLASKRRLFLGLLTDSGAPTALPADYLYEDGVLYFSLPESAPELTRIRRDGPVCAVVEQVPSYFQIKAVTLHGRPEEVPDAAIRARLLPELLRGAPSDGQVLFRLALTDVVSFDFSKIQRRH
jgi:nitroimidazol reductase NimA-like FMN-containing flavoprotein (pyridoxamine 5'-phosphate oxidase superfamily)